MYVQENTGDERLSGFQARTAVTGWWKLIGRGCCDE